MHVFVGLRYNYRNLTLINQKNENMAKRFYQLSNNVYLWCEILPGRIQSFVKLCGKSARELRTGGNLQATLVKMNKRKNQFQSIKQSQCIKILP